MMRGLACLRKKLSANSSLKNSCQVTQIRETQFTATKPFIFLFLPFDLSHGENYFLSLVACGDGFISHHFVGFSSSTMDLPERVWLPSPQKKR
jgi:hypothetical protein